MGETPKWKSYSTIHVFAKQDVDFSAIFRFDDMAVLSNYLLNLRREYLQMY